MNRRQFLRLAVRGGGVAAVTGAASITTDHLLTDRPTKEGTILFDGHVHLQNGQFSPEEIMQLVAAVGIVSFTSMNHRDYLSYDDVLRLCPAQNVEELTPGKLARVSSTGKVGYIVKSQQLDPHSFTVLALGFEGSSLPDGSSTIEAIKIIQDAGGLAVITHPFVLHTKGFPPFRPITREEEVQLREIVEKGKPDGFEVFNGSSLLWMRWLQKTNVRAEEFLSSANGSGPFAFASSNAKHMLSQVGTSGLFLPASSVSDWDSFSVALRTQSEVARQYVSLFGFGVGALRDLLYY